MLHNSLNIFFYLYRWREYNASSHSNATAGQQRMKTLKQLPSINTQTDRQTDGQGMVSNTENTLINQCPWVKAKQLKQTVSGNEFHALTILHAKQFWRAALVRLVLYSLQTWPLVLKDLLNENRLSTSISISAGNLNVIILPSSSVYNLNRPIHVQSSNVRQPTLLKLVHWNAN